MYLTNTKPSAQSAPYYTALYAHPANILILFVILISASFQGTFAADKGMDVALVLDTSGSMKKNDPRQLRVQAAKLFVSLLSRQDKVSLIGFSNRAYPITPLLSLDTQKNETKLKSAIEKMQTNGQFTNLHDAIKGGYDLLKTSKNQNRLRHIILMSDGKMDLGNKERNLRLLEDTLEELTPLLAEENIKLHTVAFTRDSYIPLLKLAAEDTGGQFIMLENANGIHQVFENIFERTKKPEMLPVYDDSFIIDKEVKEVTIVASKFKYDTVITIQTPNGDEISQRQHPSNVNWYQAKKFDLITIKKPAKGYWLIKYSEGGNKAYIVSDITLNASTTKSKAEPGAPLHIQAELKKKNRRIKNKSLLNSTDFLVKVTSPTGAVIENKLIDNGSEIGSERKDGIYGISYAFEKQGPYKIEITAKGETFDRKKTIFVDVKSETFKTPFEIRVAEVQHPDLLDSISDGKETDEKAALKAAKTKDGVDSVNDKDHDKTKAQAIDGHGKTASKHIDLPKIGIDDVIPTDIENGIEGGREAALHGDEELSAESLEANSDFGVKDAVVAFIGFNTLLLLIGGGYYFLYKRKQKEKSKDVSPTDEDNIESRTEAASEIADTESNIELEPEDGLTTSISDLDLEGELSSILENEKNDN